MLRLLACARASLLPRMAALRGAASALQPCRAAAQPSWRAVKVASSAPLCSRRWRPCAAGASRGRAQPAQLAGVTARTLVLRPSPALLCTSLAAPAQAAGASTHGADGSDVLVAAPAAVHKLVTFYCLTALADPNAEVLRHKAFCQVCHFVRVPLCTPRPDRTPRCACAQARDIRGRIYINEQGINAQLSGGGESAVEYAEWVKSDERFKAVRFSVYDAPGHSFPRLTLRYKANLVQLAGGTAHLGVLDPHSRAQAVPPAEWHRLLQRRADGGAATPVLLDVRNGYEWDAGRFQGAERPPVDAFRSTLESYSAPGGPLDGVSEDTPIMMYCTGGIRCDFYSAALRAQGCKNPLMTLEGGVQAYLETCGPLQRPDSAWAGHLFVFDARLAMDGEKRASGLNDAGAQPEGGANALTCFCCAQPRAQAPHRNCPNVDCNRLFLLCTACLQSHGGFCCTSCAQATHRRPLLIAPGERYARWCHYADGTAASTAQRRGQGRRLRKVRRKERRQEEEHELVLQALAVEMARAAGAEPPAFAADTGALADPRGTRARALRVAASLATAPETLDESSKFAQMRARLRAEATALLAAAGKEGGVPI